MKYEIHVMYSDELFSDGYICYIISGFKYKDDADAVADFLSEKWYKEAMACGSEDSQFCRVHSIKEDKK